MDIKGNHLTLTVRLRNTFGRDRIYPANDAASALAAIAGTATLEPSVLRVAKEQLGAVIAVVDVSAEQAQQVADLIGGK
jgi:hypothetical protein